METIADISKKYLDGLSERFNIFYFKEFIKDLLNLTSDDIVNDKEYSPGTELYKNYIDTVQLYARYSDSYRKNIGVLIVKLKDNKNPANARTLQRNYISHVMNFHNLDASLSAVYSENDDNWRFSFVTQELKIEVGKIKTEISPAKRFSYLFGKNEPNHTAKEQLLTMLENNSRKFNVEEIEECFSVEKVTKDFFEKYKDNYLKLKDTLDANKEFSFESERCGFTSEEFAKKLMGQIVFIYFLQKKGWLGVGLVPQKISIEEYNNIYDKTDLLGKKILDKYYVTLNGSKIIKKEALERFKENEQEIEKLSDIFINTEYNKKWGDGEKKFIRTIFKNCKNRNKNFFDDYLEPFFYQGLNHKRKNQYFSVFNCKIPFLNGGLFEPLDNYQWEIAKFNIDNSIFSNEDNDGILDFFDRYNFTMNEEEPLEKDVAVDPEMLGKIFENLLDVKDRKSKGAFYTPREIVHYMCQESLANYLVTKLGINYDEIKEFIQYGEIIRDIDLREAQLNRYLVGKSIFDNIQPIDKALEDIKVADPAVGSGAFPLGMLNEIVKLRDIITSYMIIYNRLGLFDKNYPEDLIQQKRSIYNIKWNTIKNCIYAVDIENSAVDITKLRLWLSIVVEQNEVPISGPEPLPNLDCKIMQGNSLIDEYQGIKLIEPKFVNELVNRENIRFNNRTNKGKNSVAANQIEFGDGQKKVQINELIKYKQELYSTNNPELKKELIEKISFCRKEILKLSFSSTQKISEFFEKDKSHKKPYFAWMLEFIEVFIENNGFDIVIGNPPYLGIQGIIKNSPDVEKVYKLNYESATGYYDLYTLFVENSLKRLINGKGILNFIMPHSWIVAEFGKGLRGMIADGYHFKKFINFGAYKVFNASTYTSLVWIENRIENANCLYYETNKDLNSNNELALELKNIKNESFDIIDMKNFSNKSWLFANKTNLQIMSKLNQKGLEARKVFKGIYKGITSGDNKAFCIRDGSEEGDYIIGYSAALEQVVKLEKNITKRMFVGDSLKRYEANYNNDYIIYPYKLVDNNTILLSENELNNKYPLTYNYLLAMKERLANRGTEKMKYPSWYSLWNYRKIENFENKKIITPDVCHNTSMYLDNDNYYYNDMCYALIKNDDIEYSYEYLIAILNSKLFWFFLNNTGTVLSGGFFRFKTKYIENFKIVLSNDKKIVNEIENAVFKYNDASKKEEIENEINQLVYSLYDLTNDEIRYIEDNY